ncbi:hypothetical protein GCM10010168_77730 [Actinoplanes ianthinogenes]|uniref:Ankyrin repeat domain-containing protein n=1 Tax=Actinoplanes ianthinogenes TaxID=122358 RepID=A0ABM7LKI0_9ACTN|nr:ankyrin repeat domain-containing protein [Actinoplanes ianthinogenes]BCJ39771.1 hypothetical protein Aiant_04280 [Actinoplanes ianthinogenes]GGR47484.1 hypothetical protein GCM10010168_77730 [Actinoplanes ianthinogenes]
MDQGRRLDRERYLRQLGYATPAGMVLEATAARLAGNWRAACAAAGVQVNLDLRDVADDFGTAAAEMIEADLAGLAPDYLRRHLPRTEAFRLEPGMLVVLSRWPFPFAKPGLRAGTPVLAVILPAGWESPQRLELRVIETGSLRERWVDLPEWAWHAGAVTERRWAYGASAARLPWQAGDLAGPDRASEFERLLARSDPGRIKDLYRSAGLAVEQGERPRWLPQELLRLQDRLPVLAAEARRLAFRYGDLLRDPDTGDVVLPATAWGSPQVLARADGSLLVSARSGSASRWGGPLAFGTSAPVDAALLRWGRLSPDELHPLVHEALFPGREQDWQPITHDPYASFRVRCGGEWHLVEAAGASVLTSHAGPGCAAARAGFRTGRKPVPKEVRKLRQRIFAQVFHGDTDAVLADVAAGFDPALRDGRGRTLLHLIGYLDHERVLPVLLAAGLSLEERDAAGHTPLHTAALSGSTAAMAALIAAGAFEDARDPAGNTPRQLLPAVRR